MSGLQESVGAEIDRMLKSGMTKEEVARSLNMTPYALFGAEFLPENRQDDPHRPLEGE